MSFSGEVKRELARIQSDAAHCKIAQLTAMLTICGGIEVSASDRLALRIHTENRYVAVCCDQLIREIFGIAPLTGIRVFASSELCCVAVSSHEDAKRVLTECGLIGNGAEGMDIPLADIGEELGIMDNPLLRRECCRRAYLRGAFLAAGSISDPMKFYHLEIACPSWDKAAQIQKIMDMSGLEARIVRRKAYSVLYLKEGTQIVDALGLMGATRALMELENIRILHEISNDVNRRVNCETANIGRTIAAAWRQTESIRLIEAKAGLDSLPDALREVAVLRLENPDMPLQELGKQLDPPLGKSGVNHRMERIMRIAENLEV